MRLKPAVIPAIDPWDTTTWARLIPRRRMEIGQLEAHLFRDEPKIVAAMGYRPKLETWRKPTTGGLGWTTFIANLLFSLSPVMGAAMLFAGSDTIYLDNAGRSVPGPAAGSLDTVLLLIFAFYTLAVFLPLRELGGWLARGRRRSHDTVVSFGFILIPTTVVLVVFSIAASNSDDLDLASRWQLYPVWLTGGLGLMALALTLVASTGPAAVIMVQEDARESVTIRRLITTLAQEHRAALLGERHQALDILAERGLITAAEAQAAAVTDLGTLHDASPTASRSRDS